MSLSIIIVSYNCREAVRACLRSVAQAGHEPDTFLVDNASDDDTAATVQAELPAVTVIGNDENRGFAAACNQAIRGSSSAYVLLLNPDTRVSSRSLERLVEVLDSDPRLGACGPRLVNPDGSLQRSCRRFPTLGRMVAAELGLRGRYRMHDFDHGSTREVDQLMGACLLLRRAALDEVGLLDERFFLYSEEVDLCLRLKQAGWKVLFVHDAEVTHVGGQSSRTAREFSLQHRYRSLFAFYRKHYAAWQLPLLRWAVQLGAFLRVFILRQPHYRVILRATDQATPLNTSHYN